ncbi:hypothetical protein [Hyphomicrobium sp. CS1BSMeth3]|uniref:hypothetical protein n=1 Tax=Hyphomicrobium sp. CS1BSMeth3 TaxID=1892844 RepID=UPI00092FE574|nr:hypothetical protein [Hyphomicrobium sp. CS1BSMeth3]
MPRGGAQPGERRGGRQKGTPNKSTAEVKDIARQHGPAMIEALVKLAKTAKSETARVAAIKEILDRAYGKAPQALTGEHGEGPVRHVIEVRWASDGAGGSRPN